MSNPNKLSVLIFSRNDIISALKLIKYVYNSAEEIVLIDSSDEKDRKLILQSKTNLNLKKLKIRHVVALGYPEPVRTYGVRECKCPWILYLDTDELPSTELLKNIDNLTDNRTSAYAIIRKEHAKNVSTWQVRLFKKNKVKFSGMLHELPKIDGITKRLTMPEYYLKHTSPPLPSGTKLERYFTIEAYTNRLSYADLITFAKNRNIPTGILKLYLNLRHVKRSNELSKFDYRSFIFSYSIFSSIMKFIPSSYLGWGGTFKSLYTYNNNKITYFFSFNKQERDLQFNISQAIANANGVINYLGLDKESVINALRNYSQKSRINGVNLFTILLRKRYTKGKNYYLNP